VEVAVLDSRFLAETLFNSIPSFPLFPATDWCIRGYIPPLVCGIPNVINANGLWNY
jgi:hypothetical protein